MLKASQGKEAVLETHILQLLIRQPESLYLLDRVLQKAGLTRFSILDFEHADHQMLAGIILQSLEQDDLDANQFIQERLPETLQDLVRELLETFASGEPTAEVLIEKLVQSVLRLRYVRTHAHVDQLNFMQRDAQQESMQRNYSQTERSGSRMDEFQGITQVVLQCTQVLKNLNKAIGQPVQFD